MEDRKKILCQHLSQMDASPLIPGKPTPKQLKMTQDAFRFLRGSASLFYRDLAQEKLLSPDMLNSIPLCLVQGDCHLANFGFFTEEGSFGQGVVFGLNDFDDACVGYAHWDLLRFCISLFLAKESLVYHQAQGALKPKELNAEELDAEALDPAHIPDDHTTYRSAQLFIQSYVQTCAQALNQQDFYKQAITKIPKGHVLRKYWKKALKRCPGGTKFLTKSALAKAIHFEENQVQFDPGNSRLRSVDPRFRSELVRHFEPFFDDRVLDVVERVDAGTGSVNMKRYYFLVGPSLGHFPEDLNLCHIVEVKKQRPAAPLGFYSQLSPVNRLNPAHLTQVCQRRMQRMPDLVLDETLWQDSHWLIRSRHHAKVGVSPTIIAETEEGSDVTAIEQYAAFCGRALALCHMRSDRRSHRFEQAVVNHLALQMNTLIEVAKVYTERTLSDWRLLREILGLD